MRQCLKLICMSKFKHLIICVEQSAVQINDNCVNFWDLR